VASGQEGVAEVREGRRLGGPDRLDALERRRRRDGPGRPEAPLGEDVERRESDPVRADERRPHAVVVEGPGGAEHGGEQPEVPLGRLGIRQHARVAYECGGHELPSGARVVRSFREHTRRGRCERYESGGEDVLGCDRQG
jgi:hypothetical protein